MRGEVVPWVNKRGRIQLRATVKRSVTQHKYIEISARAGDVHGQVPSYESWGHLSTYKDYHEERAIELAEEVIEEYLDDMEKQKLKGMKCQAVT